MNFAILFSIKKLNSVEDLKNVTLSDTPAPAAATDASVPQAPPATQEPAAAAPPPAPPAAPVMTNRTNPTYAGYFKMVDMGIPVQAVKHKMTMEGLDPSIMDNPDAPCE